MAKGKEKRSTAKSGEVTEITDAEFDSAIKGNMVIVDFFAEWCMPCVMMVPVIEDLAKTFSGKVVFMKINVDENQKSALNYKVMSIPTLLLFKKGAVVERITGAVSYDILKEKIENCIKK